MSIEAEHFSNKQTGSGTWRARTARLRNCRPHARCSGPGERKHQRDRARSFGVQHFLRRDRARREAALDSTHREFHLGALDSQALLIKSALVDRAAWRRESELRTASADYSHSTHLQSASSIQLANREPLYHWFDLAKQTVELGQLFLDRF